MRWVPFAAHETPTCWDVTARARVPLETRILACSDLKVNRVGAGSNSGEDRFVTHDRDAGETRRAYVCGCRMLNGFASQKEELP